MPIEINILSQAQVDALKKEKEDKFKKPKVEKTIRTSAKRIREAKDFITEAELREELFKPSFRKQKEIVISFHPFTEQMIRISHCGRFGIQYDEPNAEFVLFHYKKPIKFDYMLEMESILTINEDIEVFREASLEPIENHIIRIVRDEYAAEKAARFSDIDKVLDKEFQEVQKLKEEEEKESEEEENAEIGLTELASSGDENAAISSSEPETLGAGSEVEKAEEVLQETKQEASRESSFSEEKPKPRGIVFNSF